MRTTNEWLIGAATAASIAALGCGSGSTANPSASAEQPSADPVPSAAPSAAPDGGDSSGGDDGPLDKAEVETRIRAWLDGLPKADPMLTFDVTGKLAYAASPKSHRIQEGGYSILVNFDRPIPEGATTEQLQKQFKFVVVDAVPVPIEATGWKLELTTPMSSTPKGFTIEGLENGKLQAELKWKFFQVYGQKQDKEECPEIMDAPMPKPCFVAIEQDLPFSMRFDVDFEP